MEHLHKACKRYNTQINYVFSLLIIQLSSCTKVVSSPYNYGGDVGVETKENHNLILGPQLYGENISHCVLYALFICNNIIIFLCYPDPGTDVIISRPITVRSDADNYIQY